MENSNQKLCKQAKGFITHHCPHIDEVVAIFLLIKVGEQFFPGISKLTAENITYVDAGTLTYLGKNWRQLEKEGLIMVGVGGGRFDEHPGENQINRKEKECTTLLCAKFLGITNHPRWDRIIKAAVTNDLKGGTNPLDMAASLNRFNRKYKGHQNVIIRTWEDLEMMEEEQREFLRAQVLYDNTPKDSEKLIKFSFYRNRREYSVIAWETDNYRAAQFLRTQADILIVRNPTTGHTYLATRKFMGKTGFSDSIADAVVMVRILETKANGKKPEKNWNWKLLAGEKPVPGAEVWTFHIEGNQLLNGSNSAPGIGPSKLSLKTIAVCACTALSSKFHKEYLNQCNQGICAGRKCPWFQFGFDRCQKVREIEKEKKAVQIESMAEKK